MLHFIADKRYCTGCGACVAACPVQCIAMLPDEEGFLYPRADFNCISCGLCSRVCPLNDTESVWATSSGSTCVACCHKDRSIWQQSSSGGAFTAICEAFYKDDAAIFGARYEGARVIHDYVTSLEEIGLFRKSKYVQSDIRRTYLEVRDFLKEGKRVLFSGTPCQVAGLKIFLERNYENLLCVDLICHGVGSPAVFSSHVDYLERRHQKKIRTFSFRHKEVRFGRSLEYGARVEFADGTSLVDHKDLYTRAFIQGLFLRPSCSACVFASNRRVGDITIADFKKKFDLLPGLRGLENLSTLLVNSAKGKQVYSLLCGSIKQYSVPFESVISTNPPLRRPSPASVRRLKFFSDLEKGMQIEQALADNILQKELLMRLWELIPDRLRSGVKRRLGNWQKKSPL